jgi:hypothetical protein
VDDQRSIRAEEILVKKRKFRRITKADTDRLPQPNSSGIAALSHLLNAMSSQASKAGMIANQADILKAAFGLLIGTINTTVKIEVDGVGPVDIRPADFQFVARQSANELAQLTMNDVAKAINEAPSQETPGKDP